MEKAKEDLKNGIIKTITAEEANKKYTHTISSKKKMFFCLYCGEEVAFVRRSKENHKPFFRHSNEKENGNTCEKRNKIETYSSIYEKLGLPLYLEKENNNYSLNIGFYKIKEEILRQLEVQNAEIILESEDKLHSTKFNIDSSRFFSNKTTLIKIDFLSSKYHINYSKHSYQSLLSWGDYIDGISNEGAIFKYDSKMCRKLRINDEIYFDTDYILIRDKSLINFIDIDSKEKGILVTDKKFIVYKIRISSKNIENHSHLYDFFRINFKLILTTSPINLIPMWPPVLIKDNEIDSIFKESLYSVIKSHYEETNVYIHKNDSIEKENANKIEDGIFSLELLSMESEQTISLNDKYDSNYYTYRSIPLKRLDTYLESIIYDISGNIIEKGTCFKLPKENKIRIKVNKKCEMIVFNKNQVKAFHKIKNSKELTIDNLAYEDNVILVNGIEKISLLSFVKEDKKLMKNTCDWDDIFYRIQRINSYFVPIPPWLYRVLKSIPKDKKLFDYIRSAILENKIQKHILVLLLEKYEGVNYERRS